MMDAKPGTPSAVVRKSTPLFGVYAFKPAQVGERLCTRLEPVPMI